MAKEFVDKRINAKCNSSVPADVFGWEEGSRGVWVLDKPTQEQFDKLSAMPTPKDEAEVNKQLVCETLSHPILFTKTLTSCGGLSLNRQPRR